MIRSNDIPKIEDIVENALGERCLSDRVKTRRGWLCHSNNDPRLGPKYLCKFNYPTEADEIEYISQFIGSADKETVQEIYRQINGLSVYTSCFLMPGVLLSPDFFDGLDYFNIATDVSKVSGHEYPAKSPLRGFLLGRSVVLAGGSERRLYVILTGDQMIISGFFDDESDVTETFGDLSIWLENRISAAKRTFHEYGNEASA